MKQTRFRLTVCLMLLGLNLALIWGSSLLNADRSSAFSGWIGNWLNTLLPGLDIGSGGANHVFLRKLGHFSEFCALGMLLSWLVRMLCRKPWEHTLLPLLGGVLTACLDEGLQRLIPGRNGSLIDVGIDTLGIVAGILLITLIAIRKTNILEESKS